MSKNASQLAKLVALHLARDMALVAGKLQQAKSVEDEHHKVISQRQAELLETAAPAALAMIGKYEGWVVATRSRLAEERRAVEADLAASKNRLRESFGKSRAFDLFQTRERKLQERARQAKRERQGLPPE